MAAAAATRPTLSGAVRETRAPRLIFSFRFFAPLDFFAPHLYARPPYQSATCAL